MAEGRNISNFTHDFSHDTLSSMTSFGYVSDDVRLIFQWVFNSVISELMDVFGTVTNIINIICFVKLGFRDAVNISLLGLAISDLGCLVTLIWTNICFTPAFIELDLPFEPMEVQYITGARLHIIFTRVTSCITAFITLERCLCVAMPLKVKRIFTPTRVVIIIILIFIAVIGNMLPMYSVSKLASKFSAKRNKTIIGLVFTVNREHVEDITVAISCVLVPLIAFATVVVCTVTLVVKLQGKTKWRQMSTASGIGDNASTRDNRVTRMVIVISALFIVCFFPVCVVMVAMIVVPEFSIQGQYKNMFVSVFGVCFTLESTNSAMNIFIYYHMSSKYRTVLHQLAGSQGQ